MFLLRDTTHRMLLQYHASIGHLYVPNQRVRVPNERGGYFVATNSQGFRSDIEYAREKRGRPRILFFGDSYTAGDQSENAERFSELVGGAFDAEVYNYGLSGSGTDQNLLIYETFARDVEADLIVLGVHTDAVRRVQQTSRESIDRTTGRRVQVPKPYFTLADDVLQLHQVPVPRARPPAPETPANGSEGRGLVARAIDVYRKQEQLEALRRMVRGHLPRWQSRAYRLLGLRPYPDFDSAESPGWRLLEAIIRRFLASAAPTPVLIVPIPGYQYFLHGADPSYQALFQRFQDPARRVYVADVTQPMQRLPWEQRRGISLLHDSHFSPFGNRLLADAIASRIDESRLLERKRAPLPTVVRAKPHGTYILGISCYYHDAAACLIRDGSIVAAAQEERFTRVKNDPRFPARAVNFCLEEAGIHAGDLAAVVYHENAPAALERILRSQLAVGGRGEDLFCSAMPSWLRYKLRWPEVFRRRLGYTGPLLHDDHHRSHAASAFYPSPFERAAIVTIDGVGEWATATIGVGNGSEVRLLKEMRFPNSLGLLYSAFTQFTGFEVNEGEYKLMGLAPYGKPRYADLIRRHLVDLKADGSLTLNTEYFGFLSTPSMVNERFESLFGGPARAKNAPITRREMDLARSVQEVTEECMLRMARHAHELTGERNLCLAGGVALNCVGNGRILREGPFERVWIQPASSDAGAALGAALDAYYTHFGHPRRTAPVATTAQGGSLFGPAYSDTEVRAFLDTHGYPYESVPRAEMPGRVSALIAQGEVVGYVNGRAEFGPRALGARSILGDPRNPETQATLNLRIKYRESFRPFAPAVTEEHAADFFELAQPSPYMLIVAPVRESRRKRPDDSSTEDLLAIVRQVRSDIPAVTHVDYSARVQTVSRDHHPDFYDLIRAFGESTGTPVIVNTSFNVRGEPIVCTPYDAYRCFMRTEMDHLVLGSCLLAKDGQPEWPEPRASQDKEKAPPRAPDPLSAKLRDFHRRSLTPLATRLGPAAQLPTCDARTGWVDVPASTAPRLGFEVPLELDAAGTKVEELASAVVRSWSGDSASAELATLMPSLLSIAVTRSAARAGDEDAESAIPDSVYVMF